MMDRVCGRYVASSSRAVLADYFQIDETVDETLIEPEVTSFNVAPTDPVPAVAVASNGSRRLGLFRWGLIPSWAKSGTGAARMINARAETVRTLPAFRSAFARRRCLLPADGFYEWEKRPDGTKQPWLVHRADGAPMAFAGLWEVWRTPAGELLRTCSVITSTANALMAPIHDRMPVLIDPSDWEHWLDRNADDVDALHGLLVPADDRLLERYQVTTRVNSVRNNDPALLEPA